MTSLQTRIYSLPCQIVFPVFPSEPDKGLANG